MREGFFLLILNSFILLSIPLAAQKSLGDLLDERDSLYSKQEYLASRNSTFWGTKSKKDLRKMIENLEDILIKDNEIIAAIKRENFASRTNIIYKNRDTRSEVVKLESEVMKYKRLHKQKIEELRDTLEAVEAAKSQKFTYELIILVLFITSIGLLYYNRRLYSRLK